MNNLKNFKIFIKFRSGDSLDVYATTVAYTKPSGTPFWNIYIDNEPLIKVLQGQPTTMEENIAVYNDCAPLNKLFEKYNQIDKTKPGNLIIDYVKIRTLR